MNKTCPIHQSESALCGSHFRATQGEDVMALRTGFVVPVVLATLAVLGGCGDTRITNPIGPSSSGFSKSSLNGTYVFSASGTTQPAIINPSGPPVPNPYAMVGTFTADGSGGITGGTLDINVRGSTAANMSLNSGSNSPQKGAGTQSIGRRTPSRFPGSPTYEPNFFHCS
jgi:hypothetical protein